MPEKKDSNIHSSKLFQIGEAAKTMSVTRRMILNYEEQGLLTPAIKDEKTSYRYYTADNLTQIKLIRALQDCGLSLTEIKDYLNDTLHLNQTINRLEEMRNQIDNSIAKLRLRSDFITSEKICWTILPENTYYYKKMRAKNLFERTNELRDAYIEVLHNYALSHNGYMFTEFTLDQTRDYYLAIPVEKDCKGAYIKKLPETRALCIYYRGCYENIPQKVEKLMDFIHEKHFQVKGTSRSIYLEGPPNRGNDKDNYITQIAIPIDDEFEDIPRI